MLQAPRRVHSETRPGQRALVLVGRPIAQPEFSLNEDPIALVTGSGGLADTGSCLASGYVGRRSAVTERLLMIRLVSWTARCVRLDAHRVGARSARLVPIFLGFRLRRGTRDGFCPGGDEGPCARARRPCGAFWVLLGCAAGGRDPAGAGFSTFACFRRNFAILHAPRVMRRTPVLDFGRLGECPSMIRRSPR